MKKILSILFSGLLLSACTAKTTRLSVIVPEGTRFNSQDLDRATKRVQVTGQDTMPILLFIPIGFPSFEDALNDALKAGNGNVMVNASVKDEGNWFILFGYNRITITGDVVNVSR